MGEVGEVDEVLDHAVGLFDPGRPADGEGDVLVGVSFAPREGHTVITGDDDDGVLELPALPKLHEHFSELLVHVFAFIGVVEYVGADGFVVRPVGRDFVDVRGFLAALFDAGLELAATVRFERAIPEALWFGVGIVFEEVGEIGGVVVVRDARGRGFEFPPVVGDAGNEAFSKGRPSLATRSKLGFHPGGSVCPGVESPVIGDAEE